MKRTLAIVGSLALLAAPASGQTPLDPPRTLCTSQLMDYCATFRTWDFTYHLETANPETPGRVQANFVSNLDLFGTLMETGQTSFIMGMPTGGNGDDFWSTIFADGPGSYTAYESSGAGYPNVPTVDDISVLAFSNEYGGFQRCGMTNPDELCYEAPEPDSLLLVGTGMLGLFGIGWLKKRET